jgi:hypothetical protein
MIDSIAERFIYYPALLTQACTKVTCSVPLRMSQPRTSLEPDSPTAKIAPIAGTPIKELLPEVPLVVNSVSTVGIIQSQPTVAQLLKAPALQKDCSAALLAQVENPALVPPPPKPEAKANSTSTKAASDPKVVASAPNAPGFPQGPTNRDGYLAQRKENTERNREDNQTSRQILEEATKSLPFDGPSILEPVGVVFPIKGLKQSGRLLDGYKLDLSGTVVTQQFERLKKSFSQDIKQMISEALAEHKPRRPAQGSPPKPATARTPAPAPAPAPVAQQAEQPQATAQQDAQPEPKPKPSTPKQKPPPAEPTRRSARLAEAATTHEEAVAAALSGLSSPRSRSSSRTNSPRNTPKAAAKPQAAKKTAANQPAQSMAFKAALQGRSQRIQTMGVPAGGVPTVVAMATLLQTANAELTSH